MGKKEKKEKKQEKFDEFYLENTVYYTRIPDSHKNRETYKPLNEKLLRAFIPGTIRAITVKVGDEVVFGDSLMTLDAMKMNNNVQALYAGKVKNINVVEGDMVRKNQILIEFD